MPQDTLIDLEPIEEDGVPFHEVRELSEKALAALEKKLELESDKSAFQSVYWQLRASGYPWRVCAWVAWEAMPAPLREPKTKEQFAIEVLQLEGSRTVYDYKKKYPELENVIERLRINPLLAAMPEIWNAFLTVAKQPDYKSFHHQKLAFQMNGDFSDEVVIRHVQDGQDISELTYEELLQLEEQLQMEKNSHLVEVVDQAFEAQPNPDHPTDGLALPCEGRGDEEHQGENPVPDRQSRSEGSNGPSAVSEGTGSSSIGEGQPNPGPSLQGKGVAVDEEGEA